MQLINCSSVLFQNFNFATLILEHIYITDHSKNMENLQLQYRVSMCLTIIQVLNSLFSLFLLFYSFCWFLLLS